MTRQSRRSQLHLGLHRAGRNLPAPQAGRFIPAPVASKRPAPAAGIKRSPVASKRPAPVAGGKFPAPIA